MQYLHLSGVCAGEYLRERLYGDHVTTRRYSCVLSINMFVWADGRHFLWHRLQARWTRDACVFCVNKSKLVNSWQQVNAHHERCYSSWSGCLKSLSTRFSLEHFTSPSQRDLEAKFFIIDNMCGATSLPVGGLSWGLTLCPCKYLIHFRYHREEAAVTPRCDYRCCPQYDLYQRKTLFVR